MPNFQSPDTDVLPEPNETATVLKSSHQEIPSSKWRVMLDALRIDYSFINDSDSSLDGKAATLLGFEVSLGVGFATLGLSSLCGTGSWLTGVFGLILLGLSSILLLIIIWPRKYKTPTVDFDKQSEYQKKNEIDLLKHLFADLKESRKQNLEILHLKSKLYRAALFTLVAAALLLVLSQFINQPDICPASILDRHQIHQNHRNFHHPMKLRR
jgi:hypothetical protein